MIPAGRAPIPGLYTASLVFLKYLDNLIGNWTGNLNGGDHFAGPERFIVQQGLVMGAAHIEHGGHKGSGGGSEEDGGRINHKSHSLLKRIDSGEQK